MPKVFSDYADKAYIGGNYMDSVTIMIFVFIGLGILGELLTPPKRVVAGKQSIAMKLKTLHPISKVMIFLILMWVLFSLQDLVAVLTIAALR